MHPQLASVKHFSDNTQVIGYLTVGYPNQNIKNTPSYDKLKDDVKEPAQFSYSK